MLTNDIHEDMHISNLLANGILQSNVNPTLYFKLAVLFSNESPYQTNHGNHILFSLVFYYSNML